MERHRAVGASIAAAVLAGALVAVGPGPVQAQDSGCTEPYPPVAAFSVYPSSSSVEELDGPEVPVEVLGPSQDLAGAAELESIFLVEEVRVTRPSGDLVLRDGGALVSGLSAGDLDGDGEDEIWVGNATDGHVVPGSTPAGTYEVSAAGIRVPAGVPVAADAGFFGDGVLVLAVGGEFFGVGAETQVLSAAAVLAAGVGGDASGVVALDTVPGQPVARLAYADPQVLFAAATADGPRWWSYAEDGTEVAQFSGGKIAPPAVAVEGPGGRFFSVSSGDRSAMVYVWSYDAPCTQLEVLGVTDAGGSTTTTTPGSSPTEVEGQALKFTG
jgi:hypothetical protein